MTDFAELVLSARTDGLKRGQTELRNLTREGARTEQRVTKSTAAISAGFARMATGLGAALGGVFAAGTVIRGIAQFETSMSKVAAISGATGAELEGLRATAQRLGSTTEFSAGQAADALGFLSMAGFEASESMAAIPAVLDLATASGLDLASAADIASNVLSGFGKSADQAGNAADVLAEAASASNTSVGQLGRAMSTVAPISAALGISMEETAAAIGTMSDAGIQGERAGTALRGVMSSLAGPTDQAADALAKYGLSVADVNPETNSLTEIMGKLAESGLSTADAMTIFGREAASGALVMANAADSMGALTERFQGADGAAADMAATMRDNLGGDINGMRSAIEGLILAMGEAGLTAIIRAVVQGITGLVRGISSAVEWVGTMQGYIIAAGTALTAAYIPSLIAATSALGGMIAANAVAVAGLVTLRGALMLTGIGALVVAAGYLVNQFLKLSEATGGAGNAFAHMGEVLGLTFQGARTVVAAFGQYWSGFASSLQAVWLRFMSVVQNAWVDFLNMMASALQHIPKMEAAFNGVAGAALEAGAKASALEVNIGRAETAAASFRANAGSMLSSAFDGALAKAAQLVAIVRNVAVSQSAGPDDGSRGGQSPNAPVIPKINIPSIPKVSIPSFGGGGGGSGGGGIPQAVRDAQAEMNKLQREAETILNSLKSPQDKYNDAIDQANRLLDAGVLPMDAYTKHLDQLQAELADTKFGEMRSQVDSFTDAMFEGSDSVKDFVKTAILEFAKLQASNAFKTILGIGGQVGGGGGGLLSKFFAGFFDKGGNIPAGQFGIAAEKRSELVDGVLVRGPAKVTGGAETARMMRGRDSKQTINLRVHAADGVTVEQVGQIATGVSVQVMQSGAKRQRTALPGTLTESQNRGV